ncbi:type IV toxin-antitoxin system AbiEi family antitoxin domain-containing protein [Polynucleobacter asymbioticus]|jgi:hypothetical protein|uniref:type IV toxin-antitoxin system AbiEi family antitoxin domain-containing protein n=1 Tax=Polynucleobacter asymbioticus TaxID=576611 RepID=UPI0008F82F36|nr:type IV toxin-antitoxin system AbiEi family antitoxin domain-containing protein [Polynucleobacter asymbioticus]APC05359.1 hypothetical protein AOC10_01845 [Polynucleobacter asymbioticus]
MDIKGRILQSLRPRRDGVLLRSDASAFGSSSQVTAALHSLVESGLVERIDRGVYAKPSKVAQIGRDALLAKASLRVQASRNQLVRRTRRFPCTKTAQYVMRLAKDKRVGFHSIYADDWANSVTMLAGDEVKSDAIDDLLVALTRSGKISPKDMVSLLIRHHRDLKNV